MAIDATQRTEFEQRGWFHVGRVFEPAEFAEIHDAYDRCLQRPMSIGEEGQTPFEYSPLLHLQSDTLLRFATSPPLVELAIELVGPDVRLYWDQAVSKPAGVTSNVPWHQDNGYAPVSPEQYLTLTVALDATTEDNGCLWILPGSHRHGVVAHEKIDGFFYRGYDGDECGVAVPQVEGSVLAFSSLTLHRSGANCSGGPRRSWVIQYCDANTIQPETGMLLDDRLLIAKDGERLAEPIREREFDLLQHVAAERARS